MPSPGVYKKEIDISLYVEIASQLKIGVVGPFAKGPVNERTLITNLPALESTFGKPIDDDILCQPFFGLREYLRKGNQAYVVRVESAANPAVASKTALRGGTDDTIVTGADGATSIAATKTLTSASSSFITAGVLVGDYVEIRDTTTPGDNGFYRITNVTATVLTVDRNFTTGSLSALDFTVWTSKKSGGADGVSSAQASRTFTSTTAKFISMGVQAGDVLSIADTGTSGDNGLYVVQSVSSETTLVVSRQWRLGGLTALTYSIYGSNHPQSDLGDTTTPGKLVSTGAKFVGHKVQAGDILVISDVGTPGNNGSYIIKGLDNTNPDTTLLIDGTWPAGVLTGLTFNVYPSPLTLESESGGSWSQGYSVATKANSNSGLDFDLQVIDEGGFLVETIYGLNVGNAANTLLTNSSLVRGVTSSNRLGPSIGQSAAFTAGSDGTTGLTDSDLIGNTSQGTGLQAFKNIEEVEVDCLLIPGYTSQNIGDALWNMSEFTRGDCMFIMDPPDFPTVSGPQDVIDWHNGVGGFGRTTAINSSYGALYWPWCQILDPYTNTERWTAPSGHAIGVWANSDNIAKPWFAPAGLNRGKVTGASDVRMSPDNGERNAMQVGANVNPIVKFINDGVVVYGQKTLQRTNSALDRINVRRMLLFVERSILQATKSLPFEPGDSSTDREFVNLAKPVFEFVQANRGLIDFLVIADDTTSPPAVREQNKMIAKMFVKPTKTAEVIELQFILTAQTANFQELLAA